MLVEWRRSKPLRGKNDLPIGCGASRGCRGRAASHFTSAAHRFLFVRLNTSQRYAPVHQSQHCSPALVPCALTKDCWLRPSASRSIATLHGLHLPCDQRCSQRALPATLHKSLKAGRLCAWWCAHCILHFSGEANLVIKTFSPSRKEAGGWFAYRGSHGWACDMPTWLSESECTVHESVLSAVLQRRQVVTRMIDISFVLYAICKSCRPFCATLSRALRSVQCRNRCPNFWPIPEYAR